MKREFIGYKKGSHLGIVLSFALFIITLIFFLSILKPSINFSDEREGLSIILKEKIIEDLKSNLTVLTLSNESARLSENCLEINLESLNLSYGGYSLVKDKNGEIKDSNLVGDILSIMWQGENLFKVYFSDDFLEEQTASGLGACGEAEAVNVKKEKVIFENSIINLANDIEDEGEYENIKERYKIPDKFNFDFNFDYNNGTSVKSDDEISRETSVYVQRVPISFVDSQANTKQGELIIKIW